MNKEYEIDIKDYLRIIRRRGGIVIGIIAVCFILSILYFFYAPPNFTSTSKILVKRVESIFTSTYYKSPTEEEITNHIFLIKSYPVLEKTTESFTDDELEKMGIGTKDKAFSRMKSNIDNGRIEVSSKGESRIIEIRVTEANPYISQLFANRLAETYRSFDIEIKKEDAHSAYDFIADQTEKVQRDLEESEEKLKEFKEKYGILGISAEIEQFIRQMSDIEKELKSASIEAEVLEKKINAVKSKLNEQQKTLLTEASQTSYSVLVDLKRQLTSLENEKANLLIQGYSPEDQKILKINQSIQSLKDKMSTVARDLLQKEGTLDPLVQMEDFMQQSVNLAIDYAVAKSRIEALDEALRYYKNRLNRIPKRELELARLEREKEANKEIYLMLLEKREQAQIEEVRESGGISILELARLPKGPNTMSKVKKSVLFLILGVLLGIGGGFVVDYVDSAVRDEFEITRISGLPILGRIPVIENDKKDKNNSNGDFFVLTEKESRSHIAEAFRSLRANIKLSRAEGFPSSILITGPDAGSGKSMIAINLALSFVSSGKKVLLVDTDLRRPAIEKYLKIKKEKGLTELLVNEGQGIQPLSIDGLKVIPSGELPPNPSELLDSDRMKQLLNQWKKEYDIVLLDSPPLMTVSDSRILASEVEETLLVASYGETNRHMIAQTSELLKQLSIKALGYILNKVDIHKEYGYYGYYYGYYYYSKPGKRED
ncbi:polysaccharide biosynthesis tyrosine autokinase [candidate division WOR-3 bacterium]|nr:polysaccharide biosynthesis tyrosine autokinase [candidate division WOR-3 bacterium]